MRDLPPAEAPSQADAEHIGQPATRQSTAEPSLTEDLSALYDDTKTYAEAELTFQKTRARYVSKQATKIAAFGAGALGLVHLALIGLTIGLIIALAPLLTIWGSTALIVGLLLIGAAILGMQISKRIERIQGAFGGGKDG
jgi:hypothetical protein